MRFMPTIKAATASAVVLFSTLGLAPITAIAADASVVEEGKKIAFARKKGNCLACHQIEGGNLPGNIGPPLIVMKARFTKAELRAQIEDARRKNPNTIMPPFGTHNILTKDEIDKVVEFIHTL